MSLSVFIGATYRVAPWQGSVATHLRCGGIFSYGIIANFLLILTVKQFRKSVDNFDKVKAYKKCANLFGHHYGAAVMRSRVAVALMLRA